jgi:hypothetical protein
MRTRTRSTTTNRAVTTALAAFIAALHARPSVQAQTDAALAALAATIHAETDANAPATGRVVSVGLNRHGQHVTDLGMAVGTPYALAAHGRDVVRVYPCGTMDCLGGVPDFTL